MTNGPLQGVKILELSRVLAGPWAGQLLADYGADVIKIERPGSGDDTRQWGPPWLRDKKGNATSESAYFQSANRNKRSITVDFSHKLGQRIVTELAARSDVLIENFKFGNLARYGLDSDSVRATHPALVYCSISAYNQSGSRAAQPGYDAMIQASAGLMSVTGASDGDDGPGGPQKVGVAITDIMAGMYAVTAILAALHERNQSGEGQHINVPLYESQVAWLANQNMNFLIGGDVPARQGTAHPNIVPYQVFEAMDGHLMLTVGSDSQFRACVTCLSMPELADNQRFATNVARVEHRGELIALMKIAFQKKTVSQWLELFAASGVPAGPINSIATVLSDEYALERELVRQLPHTLAGSVPTVASPVQFSAGSNAYRRAPPLLGEHTDEILKGELGYDANTISSLKQCGVI